MFKFIAPNEEGKVNKVIELLPKHGTISYKHTKNLKHVSITCKASMASAVDIVKITSNISQIEGIIAL